uniref:30S ribosomal protein S17 n=1 Tax=Nephromyces sp. ex Molgula occidentalis TaxID=2544991 RepID=A0A5C1H7P0_9APIC|nr:30S ribosomal protein S17 [Nephromyces sp. ex Molgula occidentalis]
MNKQYIGYVILKLDNKTIKIIYPSFKFYKKYNIKQKIYKIYLVEDSRNEALKGDWIIFSKIKSKSKNKFFKLIKIINNNGTYRNNI